jgi:exodeoxyribonuclease-1
VQTLYFYDLETTGVKPATGRIMQFGGQRTDLKLKPIGEPHNFLVKLADDVLPDPEAILITGITPQQTVADGLTEAEFLKIFTEEIAVPGTIFTGFNSVRFDDEFMRYLHYRNFYDPYMWQWQDKRSRWDLLDVVRMTRALRPDGIQWPFEPGGKPSNRLEYLTKVNKLEHADAHDALADVRATIDVARLIFNKQNKLFEYLLEVRTKAKVAEVVQTGQPFVYTSGKYDVEFEKTTVVVSVGKHPDRQGSLVFDLRFDPTDWVDKTAEELAEAWKWQREPTSPRLPVKTVLFNRCPAIAPLGVLDEASQKRLKLDLKVIEKHHQLLKKATGFSEKLNKALEILNKDRQTQLVSDPADVDVQLYDGFFSRSEENTMSAIRAADPTEMVDFADRLHDQRLKTLLPLYKARNYPKSLNDEERKAWETYRTQKLTGGGEQSKLAQYFNRIVELSKDKRLSSEKQYLLEELRLYGESIMPVPDFEG